MTNKKHSTRTLATTFTKKRLIIATIIFIIIILIDTFITGMGKYAYTVVRCGRLPVVSNVNGTFGGYEGYWPSSSSRYYCTPDGAEAQGVEPFPFTAYGQKREAELKAQGNWPPQKQ